MHFSVSSEKWRPFCRGEDELTNVFFFSCRNGMTRRPWLTSKIHVSQQRRGFITWWRHQMETFSALMALCERNSPVTGEFPSQRLVTRSFDVFFDLCMDKRLSTQSWGWWFETPSCPLWRHCNDYFWVADNCAASQPEAMFENPCQLAWIFNMEIF